MIPTKEQIIEALKKPFETKTNVYVIVNEQAEAVSKLLTPSQGRRSAEEMGEKEKLARKSLQCLFIEVNALVADIQQNVLAAFKEIKEGFAPPLPSSANGGWEEISDKQLRIEIDHIFESGANEIRIYELIKRIISRYPAPASREKMIAFAGWLEKEEYTLSVQKKGMWYRLPQANQYDYITSEELLTIFEREGEKP